MSLTNILRALFDTMAVRSSQHHKLKVGGYTLYCGRLYVWSLHTRDRPLAMDQRSCNVGSYTLINPVYVS